MEDGAPPDQGPDAMTPTDLPEDDAAVVASSLTDPPRFALLYDRYAADIHRFVARRLGTGAAEDVTADVFLAAFRGRSRYDATRPTARPWLYGIAANLVGKHRRSEVRGLRALARTGTDPVAQSWVEQADERVTAQAHSAPLARALADLSAGDRDVLLLVAWADLGYQEVADALGIPLGTVRSRLHRARCQVRAALTDHHPHPHDTEEALRHG
ncbi:MULTISPECIES: RNA polymerase sigma factor [unclassified Nocardioides]|uniref:RNA polymerase sigma factor n=1 Tax=unclassified Nocardioides TaxID=2615069 RepID=UPI0009EFD7E5|nr:MULTISPECIES: RNA polymerase sigma factor [unclassified Nocardioides]GAW50843.1 RNA polymerase ECF-subfamily sigma factor [Nocardioides sp. PD653-B2]GAW52782.1 RNA polymerase ECF-subfamily sigma factor [Nocardioides sp. PD653]